MGFTKHEYTVECECGQSKQVDNDGVPTIVVKVKTNWCRKCCAECAGIPIQRCFDKNGDRVR